MFDLKLASINKTVQTLTTKKGHTIKNLTAYYQLKNGDYFRPNNFKDFPNISNNILIRLEAIGIKNTLQLYEEVLTPKCREDFSKKTGISIDEILKLTKLTDLSRIQRVNHAFLYILMILGYDTVEKVAKANYKDLYINVKQLNEEEKIYKTNLRERDIRLIIESAGKLDNVIEYE